MRVPDGKDYLEFMLHGATPEPDKYGTKNHLALEVPDCAKAVAILKARPASGDFRMEEMKVGVNRKRQVNIYDPDGSRVELMEPTTIDGKPTPPSTATPPIKQGTKWSYACCFLTPRYGRFSTTRTFRSNVREQTNRS